MSVVARERIGVVVSFAFFAALAIFILAAPDRFYIGVPGVSNSGPYNAHFVRDIGIAYAVIALALAVAVRDLAFARVATTLAALYLVAHAVLHASSETPGVLVPAIAEVLLAGYFLSKPGNARRVF